MPATRALLKASHFVPTLLVTAIGLGFALSYYDPAESIAIALAIFSGQLIVGWSNDLIDYKDDLSHNRQNKPLVAEQISYAMLQRALITLIPISLTLTIAGPLGVKGGLVYFFGIGCGAAYNLYFKFTALSPLSYALAFAVLPSCIPISLNQNPPQWVWLGGALLGMAAHFINVIKDMEQDRASNIRGLPQRIGKKPSFMAAAGLIIVGAIIIFL